MMEKLYIFENFISKKDCEKILNTCKDKLKLSRAKVGENNEINKIRNSSVAFIKNIEEVDNKLIEVLRKNINLKGYEVTELGDYQFTEYGLGEYYDWHTDSSKDMYSNRFYSVVLQLNDTYEGGLLEVDVRDKTPIQLKKGIGNLYIFQSSLLHRVIPVTEGVRYSLVNWVSLKQLENFKKTLI